MIAATIVTTGAIAVLVIIAVLVALASAVRNIRQRKFGRLGDKAVNGVNLQHEVDIDDRTIYQRLNRYTLTQSLTSRY